MLETINREHQDYGAVRDLCERYWDLYAGGEQMRRNAGRYLLRRQKEPADIYSERLARVFYENYLGACIDWHTAALFRQRPIIHFRTESPTVEQFYGDFIENCDCRQTPLGEELRRAFVRALVFGKSMVLVDFPALEGQAHNRAEEEAAGRSRAYLVGLSPQDIINWKRDESGEYEWIVIRSSRTFQERLEDSEVTTETRWSYYDKQEFRTYVQRSVGGGDSPAGNGDGAAVELVAQGRHALAEQGRVPVLTFDLPDGLWLANKAALVQQEHFNKSNALSWALHMGLFAMPVIYSEREWQQIVGEAYYIQLGPDDRFGWTEPEGKVFQIAADNLDRLKDEIYRVCYLTHQAGGRESRHLGQSGESKRRDFAVTREILRAYGRQLKDFLGEMLTAVSQARQDEIEFEISGFTHFDTPDLDDSLMAAKALRELGIKSRRFDLEVQKSLALHYLDNSSQSVKNEVVREIEESLTSARTDS